LRLADEISIRSAPDRGGVPQCEICIAGRATGLRVPGKVFEAAVEIDGRYLVFITEGVTMEELLGGSWTPPPSASCMRWASSRA
jgi:hypothetical protein